MWKRKPKNRTDQLLDKMPLLTVGDVAATVFVVVVVTAIMAAL
jgi:hypothetical protein